MAADTVEVVVKLSGLGAVQAGMRQVRSAVTAPLEAAVGRVRNLALGLGSTLLAGFSLHRIGSELNQALGDMDRVDAAAQKLGIVTSELTALEHAAQLADATVEELHGGLKFLARSAESNSEAFATLGIQVHDASGKFRPSTELLADIADRFTAMPDGVGKTALALELFGRQGLTLIPMLNAGSEGIRQMKEEARSLGLVVGGEVAAGASTFNDNLTRLRSAVDGLARTALAQLLPALVELSERLVAWVRDNDAVRRGAAFLSEALRYLVFDIQALIVAARIWWNTSQAQVAAVGKAFEALGRLLARVWEQPIEVLRALIAHLKVALQSVTDLGAALGLLAQGRFGEARTKAKEAARDLAESFAEATRAMAESSQRTGSAFIDALVTPIAGATVTMWTLFDESRKGFEELLRTTDSLWHPSPLPAPPQAGGGTDPDFEPAHDRRRQLAWELREAQDDLRRRRREIADELVRLETDFATREADKHRARIDFLRQELALIEEATRALEAKIEVERDQEARQAMLGALRSLEGEGHSVQSQLTRQQGAPDPYSMRDQMVATITELENRLGTAAEAVARAFSGVVGTAIDGIAHGIEGLIRGTVTWADALRSIGSSILNGVITAISRMFAEWIAKRALMAVKNMLFSKQEGAADAAAKAPGAMMTSISSFGVASVVGMAAMLAALAAISGAFAKGGRPTPGMPALVGEQGPELFVPDRPGMILPAGITDRIMSAVSGPTEGFYQAGEMEPRPGFAGPTPQAQEKNLNLVLVDDRRHAREFLESADGQALIIDLVRRRRMDIGLKT